MHHLTLWNEAGEPAEEPGEEPTQTQEGHRESPQDGNQTCELRAVRQRRYPLSHCVIVDCNRGGIVSSPFF